MRKMSIRPADYQITECGCPQMMMEHNNTDSKKIFYKFQNNNGSNNNKCVIFTGRNKIKLLPLRETMNEYCARLLNKTTRHVTNNNTFNDPTPHSKQHKNYINESLRAQQNKRNINRPTGVPLRTWSVKITTAVEEDLDDF